MHFSRSGEGSTGSLRRAYLGSWDCLAGIACCRRSSASPSIRRSGAGTAKALAHWQGRKDDEKTREQPGKILHELRVGELAHLHEVSQTPSYAAVDSTLLFLIAIARHVKATGNLDLFAALRPNIDRALGWLERKIG